MSNSNEQSKDLPVKIERLYVKEISCRIPRASGLLGSPEFKDFTEQISPSLEISTKIQTVAENKYEVVLHAIVNGKAKNNASLFVLDVQQAGIFIINASVPQLKQIVELNCASFLYPYLSQVISNAILQTVFPPIVLQPFQPLVKQELTRENNYSDQQGSLNQSIKHRQETIVVENNKKSTFS